MNHSSLPVGDFPTSLRPLLRQNPNATVLLVLPEHTPRWLQQLAHVLARYRIPVRELTCNHGTLRMALSKGSADLEITVRPKTGAGPGWAETEGFVIGYRGPDRLEGPRQRWLDVVLQVIERMDHVLPPALDEPGALFDEEVSPAQRFASRFPFCDVERAEVDGSEQVEVLVRASATCNQGCPFCSAPETRTPTARQLAGSVTAAAHVWPGCVLTLTGGEPTLRPAFFDEVRQALDQPGVGHVQVQTNAVTFAKKLDPADLPPGERLSFFVSLHALDPALYDACTATAGQLELALAGMERLLAAGHPVTINCVVSTLNLEHLDAYVEALPRRLPVAGSSRAVLHFSVLICPEHRPDAADYLVRYGELAPRLEAAASRAEALGLTVDSLRSSTHASMPACVLGAAFRHRDPHRPHVRPGETGHEPTQTPWLKAARCKTCPEDPWCLGVPAAYARRFGLDELQPLPDEP